MAALLLLIVAVALSSVRIQAVPVNVDALQEASAAQVDASNLWSTARHLLQVRPTFLVAAPPVC